MVKRKARKQQRCLPPLSLRSVISRKRHLLFHHVESVVEDGLLIRLKVERKLQPLDSRAHTVLVRNSFPVSVLQQLSRQTDPVPILFELDLVGSVLERNLVRLSAVSQNIKPAGHVQPLVALEVLEVDHQTAGFALEVAASLVGVEPGSRLVDS